MASKAEHLINRSLRAILDDLPNGGDIPASDQCREALAGLARFIPAVLSELYPEWNLESLDGVLPVRARKSGEGEAEIFGICIVLPDQTLMPLHLRIQIAACQDEVSWLECRLGERGPQRLVRNPCRSLDTARKRLYLVEPSQIDWIYKVTFGHRRLL